MGALRARGGSTLRRYLAFQVPGWIVAALAGIVAVRLDVVGPAVATVAVLAWVAKDLALFRFVGHAYAKGDGDPAARLLGGTGIVERGLDPEGMVRLGHELWTARSESGPAIEPGARVEVVAVEGLVLIVERERRSSGAGSPAGSSLPRLSSPGSSAPIPPTPRAPARRSPR